MVRVSDGHNNGHSNGHSNGGDSNGGDSRLPRLSSFVTSSRRSVFGNTDRRSPRMVALSVMLHNHVERLSGKVLNVEQARAALEDQQQQLSLAAQKDMGGLLGTKLTPPKRRSSSRGSRGSRGSSGSVILADFEADPISQMFSGRAVVNALLAKDSTCTTRSQAVFLGNDTALRVVLRRLYH
jgi:hypothetical protein